MHSTQRSAPAARRKGAALATEQLALVLDRFAKTPERAQIENVKRVVSPVGEWFLAGDHVEAAVPYGNGDDGVNGSCPSR